MLNNSVDILQVGRSYFSFLLGIDFLEQGHSTLLLDDERYMYGSLYTDYLTHLEFSFLKVWGEERNIAPLLDLESYIVPAPTTFVIDGKMILLGRSIKENVRELTRKLPYLFDEETFNSSQIDFEDSFESFSQSFYKNLFRYKNLQNFDSSAFISCLNPSASRFLAKIIKKIKSGNTFSYNLFWELKTFLYTARTSFQSKLSLNFSDFELYHLLISILSPVYKLDNDRICKDLLEVFIERGGRYQQSIASSWHFDRKRPWAIELDSYEGIVHPKKMIFLSGETLGLPIATKKTKGRYQGVMLTFDFEEPVSTGGHGDYAIFSSLERVGTQIPVWFGKFRSKQIKALALVREQDGVKEELISESIKKLVLKDIKSVIPEELPEYSYSCKFTSDIFPFDSKSELSFKKLLATNAPKVNIEDRSNLPINKGIKNVYYVGPSVAQTLGKLSTLVQIKDTRFFFLP